MPVEEALGPGTSFAITIPVESSNEAYALRRMRLRHPRSRRLHLEQQNAPVTRVVMRCRSLFANTRHPSDRRRPPLAGQIRRRQIGRACRSRRSGRRSRAHANPLFRAMYDRIIEGLRKAGMPEE